MGQGTARAPRPGTVEAAGTRERGLPGAVRAALRSCGWVCRVAGPASSLGEGPRPHSGHWGLGDKTSGVGEGAGARPGCVGEDTSQGHGHFAGRRMG